MSNQGRTGNKPLDVIILGSTGSVGTQALDVVGRNRDLFRVVGLAAAGQNVQLLARQAIELSVETVGVSTERAAEELRLALSYELASRVHEIRDRSIPEILSGPDAATALAAAPCDAVLNGIAGSVSLGPSLAALGAGHDLILANKESLVAGGPLLKGAVAENRIIPVDTEHSGLAQCVRAGRTGEISRMTLTELGGPFRGYTRAELADVAAAQALSHPVWSMGRVIIVNSATLVNKALELIEASVLFDIPLDDIDVLIHPQAAVHAMVSFSDGSTMAQVSRPDTRLALSLGLGWPDRVAGSVPPYDWTSGANWEFYPVDNMTLPAIELAREAGKIGGVVPAIFNAANEVCVGSFLEGALPFDAIVDTVEQVVVENRFPLPNSPDEVTLDDIRAAESWAVERTARLIEESTVRI
jgi:1-deoxy-D-xylulose-5-phosphate reductoisomerase